MVYLYPNFLMNLFVPKLKSYNQDWKGKLKGSHVHHSYFSRSRVSESNAYLCAIGIICREIIHRIYCYFALLAFLSPTKWTLNKKANKIPKSNCTGSKGTCRVFPKRIPWNIPLIESWDAARHHLLRNSRKMGVEQSLV